MTIDDQIKDILQDPRFIALGGMKWLEAEIEWQYKRKLEAQLEYQRKLKKQLTVFDQYTNAYIENEKWFWKRELGLNYGMYNADGGPFDTLEEARNSYMKHIDQDLVNNRKRLFGPSS